MKYYVEQYEQMASISTQDIVKAGGACIGSPDTCIKVVQHLSDGSRRSVALHAELYDFPRRHHAVDRTYREGSQAAPANK